MSKVMSIQNLSTPAPVLADPRNYPSPSSSTDSKLSVSSAFNKAFSWFCPCFLFEEEEESNASYQKNSSSDHESPISMEPTGFSSAISLWRNQNTPPSSYFEAESPSQNTVGQPETHHHKQSHLQIGQLSKYSYFCQLLKLFEMLHRNEFVLDYPLLDKIPIFGPVSVVYMDSLQPEAPSSSEFESVPIDAENFFDYYFADTDEAPFDPEAKPYDPELDSNFKMEQIANHIEFGLPSFRCFNGADCVVANIEIPQEAPVAHVPKVRFPDENDEMVVEEAEFDKNDPPMATPHTLTNSTINTVSRMSKTKKISPCSFSTEEEPQYQPPVIEELKEEFEKLVEDSDFTKEEVGEENYDGRVDELINRFTDMHEKLSHYNNHYVNKRFVEFANLFKDTRLEVEGAVAFANALFSELEQLVQNEDGDFNRIINDISFIQQSQMCCLDDLDYLKLQVSTELENIATDLFHSRQMRLRLSGAYSQFYDAHCAIYELDQKELDDLFNKTLYDQSCFFQDNYTCKEVKSVYTSYLEVLEDASDYLSQFAQLLEDAIEALGFS